MALQKVGAAMTRGVVKTAATLTALKAAVPLEDGAAFQTLARSTEGDAGGESWTYDSASTTTPDDLTVIRPDSILGSNPGRYKLNYIGRGAIRVFPTGVAATDTALVRAALAAGSASDKPIEIQRNGNRLRINDWFNVPSDVTYYGNYVIHEAQMGSGGYEKKNRTNKNNVGGTPDTMFLIGASGAERERVRFYGCEFTASDETQAIFRAIVSLNGFDESELIISDMVIRDMLIQSAGAVFSINSCGTGGFRMENLRGRDCGLTEDATGWTGVRQITLWDVDDDGTDSSNGVVRNTRAVNWKFSGDALVSDGQQADVGTIARSTLSGKPHGITVDDIYGEETGEVLDCMGERIQISSVTGKNVETVLKFVHGARSCSARGVVGTGIGSSLIVFGGSSAVGSGDTMRNTVSGFVANTFNTNEAVAVLFQKNTGSTGLPKYNTCFGGQVDGDSNGDHLVKCNNDGANLGNRVYLLDGRSWGTKTTSVVATSNTKVVGPARGVCQLSLGGNQTVSTLAKLDFSVATYDPEGIADTSNDQVVIKWPGLYIITVALRFSTDLDDQDLVEIRLVGGGTTRVRRRTIGKSAEEDIVSETFHVLIKDEDIGAGAATVYAQAAVEGASNATVVATADYTGMWITRAA